MSSPPALAGIARVLPAAISEMDGPPCVGDDSRGGDFYDRQDDLAALADELTQQTAQGASTTPSFHTAGRGSSTTSGQAPSSTSPSGARQVQLPRDTVQRQAARRTPGWRDSPVHDDDIVPRRMTGSRTSTSMAGSSQGDTLKDTASFAAGASQSHGSGLIASQTTSTHRRGNTSVTGPGGLAAGPLMASTSGPFMRGSPETSATSHPVGSPRHGTSHGHSTSSGQPSFHRSFPMNDQQTTTEGGLLELEMSRRSADVFSNSRRRGSADAPPMLRLHSDIMDGAPSSSASARQINLGALGDLPTLECSAHSQRSSMQGTRTSAVASPLPQQRHRSLSRGLNGASGNSDITGASAGFNSRGEEIAMSLAGPLPRQATFGSLGESFNNGSAGPAALSPMAILMRREGTPTSMNPQHQGSANGLGLVGFPHQYTESEEAALGQLPQAHPGDPAFEVTVNSDAYIASRSGDHDGVGATIGGMWLTGSGATPPRAGMSSSAPSSSAPLINGGDAAAFAGIQRHHLDQFESVAAALRKESGGAPGSAAIPVISINTQAGEASGSSDPPSVVVPSAPAYTSPLPGFARPPVLTARALNANNEHSVFSETSFRTATMVPSRRPVRGPTDHDDSASTALPSAVSQTSHRRRASALHRSVMARAQQEVLFQDLQTSKDGERQLRYLWVRDRVPYTVSGYVVAAASLLVLAGMIGAQFVPFAERIDPLRDSAANPNVHREFDLTITPWRMKVCELASVYDDLAPRYDIQNASGSAGSVESSQGPASYANDCHYHTLPASVMCSKLVSFFRGFQALNILVIITATVTAFFAAAFCCLKNVQQQWLTLLAYIAYEERDVELTPAVDVGTQSASEVRTAAYISQQQSIASFQPHSSGTPPLCTVPALASASGNGGPEPQAVEADFVVKHHPRCFWGCAKVPLPLLRKLENCQECKLLCFLTRPVGTIVFGLVTWLLLCLAFGLTFDVEIHDHCQAPSATPAPSLIAIAETEHSEHIITGVNFFKGYMKAESWYGYVVMWGLELLAFLVAAVIRRNETSHGETFAISVQERTAFSPTAFAAHLRWAKMSGLGPTLRRGSNFTDISHDPPSAAQTPLSPTALGLIRHHAAAADDDRRHNNDDDDDNDALALPVGAAEGNQPPALHGSQHSDDGFVFTSEREKVDMLSRLPPPAAVMHQSNAREAAPVSGPEFPPLVIHGSSPHSPRPQDDSHESSAKSKLSSSSRSAAETMIKKVRDEATAVRRVDSCSLDRPPDGVLMKQLSDAALGASSIRSASARLRSTESSEKGTSGRPPLAWESPLLSNEEQTPIAHDATFGLIVTAAPADDHQQSTAPNVGSETAAAEPNDSKELPQQGQSSDFPNLSFNRDMVLDGTRLFEVRDLSTRDVASASDPAGFSRSLAVMDDTQPPASTTHRRSDTDLTADHLAESPVNRRGSKRRGSAPTHTVTLSSLRLDVSADRRSSQMDRSIEGVEEVSSSESDHGGDVGRERQAGHDAGDGQANAANEEEAKSSQEASQKQNAERAEEVVVHAGSEENGSKHSSAKSTPVPPTPIDIPALSGATFDVMAAVSPTTETKAPGTGFTAPSDEEVDSSSVTEEEVAVENGAVEAVSTHREGPVDSAPRTPTASVPESETDTDDVGIDDAALDSPTAVGDGTPLRGPRLAVPRIGVPLGPSGGVVSPSGNVATPSSPPTSGMREATPLGSRMVLATARTVTDPSTGRRHTVFVPVRRDSSGGAAFAQETSSRVGAHGPLHPETSSDRSGEHLPDGERQDRNERSPEQRRVETPMSLAAGDHTPLSSDPSAAMGGRRLVLMPFSARSLPAPTPRNVDDDRSTDGEAEQPQPPPDSALATEGRSSSVASPPVLLMPAFVGDGSPTATSDAAPSQRSLGRSGFTGTMYDGSVFGSEPQLCLLPASYFVSDPATRGPEDLVLVDLPPLRRPSVAAGVAELQQQQQQPPQPQQEQRTAGLEEAAVKGTTVPSVHTARGSARTPHHEGDANVFAAPGGLGLFLDTEAFNQTLSGDGSIPVFFAADDASFRGMIADDAAGGGGLGFALPAGAMMHGGSAVFNPPPLPEEEGSHGGSMLPLPAFIPGQDSAMSARGDAAELGRSAADQMLHAAIAEHRAAGEYAFVLPSFARTAAPLQNHAHPSEPPKLPLFIRPPGSLQTLSQEDGNSARSPAGLSHGSIVLGGFVLPPFARMQRENGLGSGRGVGLMDSQEHSADFSVPAFALRPSGGLPNMMGGNGNGSGNGWNNNPLMADRDKSNSDSTSGRLAGSIGAGSIGAPPAFAFVLPRGARRHSDGKDGGQRPASAGDNSSSSRSRGAVGLNCVGSLTSAGFALSDSSRANSVTSGRSVAAFALPAYAMSRDGNGALSFRSLGSPSRPAAHGSSFPVAPFADVPSLVQALPGTAPVEANTATDSTASKDAPVPTAAPSPNMRRPHAGPLDLSVSNFDLQDLPRDPSADAADATEAFREPSGEFDPDRSLHGTVAEVPIPTAEQPSLLPFQAPHGAPAALFDGFESLRGAPGDLALPAFAQRGEEASVRQVEDTAPRAGRAFGGPSVLQGPLGTAADLQLDGVPMVVSGEYSRSGDSQAREHETSV